jgi:hypothetical protein
VCDDEDFRRYRGLRWLRIGLGVKDYYGEKKEKKEGKSRWEMMLIRGKTALSIAICMGFIGYIWTLYLPLGQILAGKLPFTASNLRDTVRFT